MPTKKHNKSKLQKGSGIGSTIKGWFTPSHKKGSAKLEQVHEPNNNNNAKLLERSKLLRKSGPKSLNEVRAREQERLRIENKKKREAEEELIEGSTKQIVYKPTINNIGRSSSGKVSNPHELQAVVITKKNGKRETVRMTAKAAALYAEKKAAERRKKEEKEAKRKAKEEKRKTRKTSNPEPIEENNNENAFKNHGD